MTSQRHMQEVLTSAGWKQKLTSMSWSWFHPKFPHILYRLSDAYALEMSRRPDTKEMRK